MPVSAGLGSLKVLLPTVLLTPAYKVLVWVNYRIFLGEADAIGAISQMRSGRVMTGTRKRGNSKGKQQAPPKHQILLAAPARSGQLEAQASLAASLIG